MGFKNHLIDTNVIIYYFGQVLATDSISYLEEILKNSFYISVINRIELLGCEGLSENEFAALDSFINSAFIFDLDEAIIKETIRIRRSYKIKLPDAIIAATCLVNDCCLITNNTKDFSKIESLQIHAIKLN